MTISTEGIERTVAAQRPNYTGIVVDISLLFLAVDEDLKHKITATKYLVALSLEDPEGYNASEEWLLQSSHKDVPPSLRRRTRLSQTSPSESRVMPRDSKIDGTSVHHIARIS